MKQYNHKQIEKKWQKRWEKDGDFNVSEDAKKQKYYCLIEFPYPSGDGLHVGHIRSNTAMDIIARKRRAEGFEVLYPIGWDAFGLPTENYALKTGIPPQEVTKKNTDRFREQFKALGLSFDWSREINTTDPKYYKWTQWIFLKLYEKGLAYKKKMPINWCIDCKIGLANEEAVDAVCDRCGGKVEMREKEQWMLKITDYADRLDKDLDDVDYLEKIKVQQRNWIGRSEGVEIEFNLKTKNYPDFVNKIEDPRFNKSNRDKLKTGIKVFTTRPDTLFGVTYLVLAPEHELLKNNELGIKNYEEVKKYIEKAKNKTDIERTKEGQGETGVVLEGVSAINPANKEEIPIFVADYVLAHYGTGAIMAVPAHDQRDFEFAQKFKLPIKMVVCPHYPKKTCPVLDEAYIGDGHMVDSGEFDGLSNDEAKEKITSFVSGKKKTTYKLRDWIFSRQRYWGEPIPIIHCEKCGIVPVPEKDLPVELPLVEKYEPTETGESPLAAIDEWVNVPCPECGGNGKRETDTMPNWAGSSWYYLAYIMLGISNFQFPISRYKKSFEKWLPVDWYNGGMEQTTLHLLYSRFWHKFLYDIDVVPTSEPYQKRTSHGLVLAADGEKMSKSKGNVVNPDKIIEFVGADSLRMHEMFMGSFGDSVSWNTDNIAGVRRFLERMYNISAKSKTQIVKIKNKELERLMHQTIKKVGEDIEAMKFNTAISAMMIFLNEIEKMDPFPIDAYKILVRLCAPFAPHITEEIWEYMGGEKSIHKEPWPSYNENKLKNDSHVIVVQINGKVRDQFKVTQNTSEDEVKRLAFELPNVVRWVKDKTIEKVIYIDGRLLNIVVGK